MINPKFPFDGKQIILTSDRVMLHAKNDGIFLFGKNMVSIASNQTINLDSSEKILLDCDKIELGHKAETLGQPILLGRSFIDNLILLLNSMQEAASLLQTVAETNPAGSFINIQSAGNTLYSSVSRLQNILETEDNPQNPLSKITFSR